MDAFQNGLVDLLPRLRRFARAVAGGALEADVLVQAAVQRGLDRRGQWRPDTRLDSWMFTIMTNAWIDATLARGRREPLFASSAVGGPVAGSDGEALRPRLEAREVAAAMDGLPEGQRLAVALVLVEGFSFREAAEVLDIPAGALANRLVCGRHALLACLEGGVAA